MKAEIVENKKRVLAPMRFVNAIHNFTPLQEDFIFLIQRETGKSNQINTSVTIDLKDYIKSKGLNIKDVRSEHYNRLCKELLNSIVSFKYFESSSLVHYNLFKSMRVEDFVLYAEIIEEVVPLFYINALKQNHFLEDKTGSKLSIELFEKSYPEYDKYVSMKQDVFLVDLKQSEEKALYRKIISERHQGNHRLKITKEELYYLLGCGSYREIPNTEDIFGINKREFVVTSYEGSTGWNNLRRKIDKWLKSISDNPESEINFKLNERGNGFLTLKGRPTKYVYIDVEYSKLNNEMSDTQKEHYSKLINVYKLSTKQAKNIIKDYTSEEIVDRIRTQIEPMKDPISKKHYFVVRNSQKNPKTRIENLPGYVYGVVFGYNTK